MKELGIDEAGRGPVIGPMVMAGVVVNEDGKERLKALGVKDSKKLTPLVREKIFADIKNIALSYKIVVLTPEEIDQALFSPTNNLNKFEMINMAMIANALDTDVMILDSPSSNTEKFKNEFKIFLKDKNKKVIAENSADDRYVSVAAASVLAKVTRDREIEKIKMKHSIDFGSGYPSDPKTKIFLDQNHDKYNFFRKSWASYKRIAKKKDSKQSTLGKF